MPVPVWKTKLLSVASLHLDQKNPRLGRETSSRAPRDIVQYLFLHDKAVDVAESIAIRGYFPNEPLLAIREDDRYVVVEGNRRLAALKALREPGLLEGSIARRVERLSRRLTDRDMLSMVPVTIAPDRRSTDRQIAGRHVGTPVLAWQAENRASFILEKLEEGYTNSELSDELGFTSADIQKARLTRGIADMARSLELPDEIKAKLENPRANLFTTLERVFESTVGRDYMKVEPDADHGIRGKTSKAEFAKAFKKLVTDVALGKESSRTLNSNENIEQYFRERWTASELPAQRRGTFIPADLIDGRSVASLVREPKPAPRKSSQISQTVVPSSLKVRVDSERLIDIRRELVKLKRAKFPNAGAVLLRVFLELSVVDYLRRTGELDELVRRLNQKGVTLPFGVPTMKLLVPEINRIAKGKLTSTEATKVEKALRYDVAAPFTVSDLHAFVHGTDFPSDRDILQFWLRTEPLFRLMLEHPMHDGGKA